MRGHVLPAVAIVMVALLAGCMRLVGGRNVGTSTPNGATVTLSASPQAITLGQTATLSWTSTNASAVQIDNGVGGVPASGSMSVSPKQTTTYTITASGSGGNSTATATVTVNQPPVPQNVNAINHVIFMMQENRSFDSYFGMLNPYRKANGWNVGDNGQEFDVDGLDGSKAKIANPDDQGNDFSPFRLATTCFEDMSSAWLESYGDVNRNDFTLGRAILMNGFVHTAEGNFDSIIDKRGKRAMGYYDEQFLNYYYFLAAQFAVSDRWFTPIASKTVPNRIAVLSGGTTQGLVRDPGLDDHLGDLGFETIFQELDNAKVSWKIYYISTQSSSDPFPASTFPSFNYSLNYINKSFPCSGNTVPSSAVGDSSNSFCIDPTHIAPISQYFTDLQNGKLAQFVYIEPGFTNQEDEHPGADVTVGQAQVAKIINAFMQSSSWNDSVFFFAFDEGGGPFDHVPPVPGHTNDYTDASLGITTDIGSIAVNADNFKPCPAQPGSFHCDLQSYGGYADPGYFPQDATFQQGFRAQLGFRVPNIVISPFTRKHYVSHVPMDHTGIIKFVESRFIGSDAHLTERDRVQPDMLDFFDFVAVPWKIPPTPPTPASPSCNPGNL